MKKMLEEFKKFALRGNVLELAVGLVIGSSFTAIVNSLVNDVISPLVGLLVRVDFSALCFRVGEVSVGYGAFLMAIVNFVIVAWVLFLLVRGVNKLSAMGRHEAAPAPSTKKCPYCLSDIPLAASRCPRCTSALPGEGKEV